MLCVALMVQVVLWKAGGYVFGRRQGLVEVDSFERPYALH